MKVIQGSEYKVYLSKSLESYISMFICEDGEFSGKLIGTLIRGSDFYTGLSLTFTIVPISYKLYGSNRYRKARFYPHYPEENSTWYIDEGKFY